MKSVLDWIDVRFPIKHFFKRNFSEYYLPKNLNVYYLMGVFALLLLVNQCVTGFWLTMFYTPTSKDAFSSIQTIMRDVQFGWLFRYMHTTGASAFFMVIFIHIFKALLYGSYQKPRELVWIFGMILYCLLVIEAFLGYVLPWGQLSYWGAQVVTTFLSAIPWVGETLMLWVRGDYVVGDATLHRFFALHVIGVPFLLISFVVLHLKALRKVGSNNPEGIQGERRVDKVPFYPYYVLKDLVGIVVFLMLFFFVVFFVPDVGGYFLEPQNSVEANPLMTPEHLVPAWYLAPFYAMLRVIPNKGLGLLVVASSIFLLFLLPWLDKSRARTMHSKGIGSKVALFAFVVSFLTLGYLGTIDVTPLRVGFGRCALVFYLAYFVLMPVYTCYESRRCNHE